MKKMIVFIVVIAGLVVLYKRQHVRPVDDPKDSPIFQERLKSSLDRFQSDGLPQQQAAQMQGQRAQASPGMPVAPATRPAIKANGLMADGRCGAVNLTWVEQGQVVKDSFALKRRAAGAAAYTRLASAIIYDRPEAGGTRYWTSDEGLQDGKTYEYMVTCNDSQGKALTKGPLSITLMCTEQDREYLKRREQAVKEYYASKGIQATGSAPAQPAAPQPTQQARPLQGLFAAGRCGKTTVTWLEEKKIIKESIQVKRRMPDGSSVSVAAGSIYERAEGQGTRYWIADSGLQDGARYEYTVTYKDALGRELVQGPAAISPTCTEQDKAFLAQQQKAVEDYYKQKGMAVPQQPAAAPSAAYELSRQVYQVDPGASPRTGSTDAAIRLVVFTDFECVHCGTWAQTLDNLLKKFPRDIEIVFKCFPIPYHRNAELAALAALAAGRQGKFWEMHDLLFKNNQALSMADILGYARTLGLDIAAFEQALKDDALKKLIAGDKAQGLRLGVQNTPTTFINGRSLIGSPPLAFIEDLVVSLLKAKGPAQ
jgi:protein-disulfide isomerase